MSDAAEVTWQESIASHLRFSIAAWVSIALGCALVIATLTTWIIFRNEPQRVAWADFIQWEYLLLLFLLGAIICCVAYWTVRLWSEDLPAQDDDLEIAWQAGINAARKRGTSLLDLPLFLVIGCNDEKAITEFVRQAKLNHVLEAKSSPSTAPIRWMFAEDRILLLCSDVGVFTTCQSRLALYRQQAITQRQTSLAEELEVYRPSISITNQNTATREETHAASRTSFADLANRKVSSQTAFAMKGSNRPTTKVGQASTTQAFIPSASNEQTMPGIALPLMNSFETLDTAERLIASWNDSHQQESEFHRQPLRRKEHTSSLLTSREIAHCQIRLEDLCRRLKSARRALAPINGILVWVDAPQLADCVGFSRQCGRGLHRDLSQLREQLGVIAPVTFVFERMQEIPGFTELVRRSGMENALHSTLGEAYPIESLINRENLDGFCVRSFQSMISKIYRCFHHRNGLMQPENYKLFQLVLAGRGRLLEATRSLVLDSLVEASQGQSSIETDSMSGVFFTASGDKPTQSGFSPLVLQRQLDQQELLSWTRQRIRSELRYRQGTLLLKAVCVILAIALIVQLSRWIT